MITWIEGQNSTGKTILVKKLLGATFEQKGSVPINIINDPLDIKNDFPDRLVPSDFVFYYDISLPKHVTFTVRNSQIHIFLEKVRGNAKERNKIFRLYEKFITQHDVIKEKEQYIKKLEDAVKSRYKLYDEEYCEWQTTEKELEEKLKRHEYLSAEIDKLSEIPVYKKYEELLDAYIKSKYTDKRPSWVHTPLWDEVEHYKKQHKEIIKPLYEKKEKLFNEMESFGRGFELTKKLKEHRRCIPETPYVSYKEGMIRHVKNNLVRYKKKLVTKEEILELVKNFSYQKKIWIDGKPSSQFEDFYDLIELMNTLSPEELFISHCGNKMWFNNAFRTPYKTSQGDLTLNLKSFKKVYIEVPSMHEKVLISEEKRYV